VRVAPVVRTAVAAAVNDAMTDRKRTRMLDIVADAAIAAARPACACFATVPAVACCAIVTFDAALAIAAVIGLAAITDRTAA